MTSQDEKISDLMLERYLLNELPPEKQKAIKQLIENNPSYQNKLKTLEEDNKAFYEKYSPSTQLEIIQSQAKARSRQSHFGPKRLFQGASALAGMLLIFFLIRPALMNHPTGDGTERLKGLQPELRVYRKSGGKIETLKNKSTAKEGDLLQLSYIAAGKNYGVIFSVDGRKSFTLHFPSPNNSQKLEQKKQILLAHSYELDDAPEFERFFFISSDKPISSGEIKSIVENWLKNTSRPKTEKLKLPEHLIQNSITIIKEQ